MRPRKRYDSNFKAKVALEAVKGEKTIAELSSEYGVHANQISMWKKKLLSELPDLFSDKRKREAQQTQQNDDRLYQKIGQLEMELDWLKKKSPLLK